METHSLKLRPEDPKFNAPGRGNQKEKAKNTDVFQKRKKLGFMNLQGSISKEEVRTYLSFSSGSAMSDGKVRENKSSRQFGRVGRGNRRKLNPSWGK